MGGSPAVSGHLHRGHLLLALPLEMELVLNPVPAMVVEVELDML